ncbi:MAG TPA: hypothetical protein VF723_03945 [Pyrinomonadaceae bacterium]|jgi:hypothetical protein
MSPKELAAHYQAKVFDSREAAEAAGFAVTETMSPRNVWNKSSAAQAIIHRLLARKQTGEAAEIGLVLEGNSVSGCYKQNEGGK